ncbi:bifunctional riboflavin kinase/FAD synthetase [Zavarzinia compransoris]|uniref:Riboflavin biosynthesis protein n=1 Tax=Zavarzinia compransoris TaxID=1264899 RepID=A0A317E9J0_9PROT|nr:bifunctional riboflavin kinase/FAD synthetase [Zavarzinia compransoris]PWR23559.1 riboflavin biosynthesis protein RibF [Zavarzinia compransoris]TDP47771.1 FMN adenylyltransferase /riboflavin kinase [Zavarzinia compransoris]
MLVVDRLDHVPPPAQGAVLAIGNFDGVHRGHHTLLGTAARIAGPMGAPAGVLTFEPHPRLLFRPDTPPFRLTPPADKLRLLAAAGAEVTAVLPFTATLAAMPAADFVLDILVGRLRVVHIVIGFDFCFGQGRGGDVAVLHHMGEMEGFGVTVLDPVGDSDCRPGEGFSSSAIRKALQAGDIATATGQLGRPWSVTGIVARGDQRGRTIGFPTANLPLGDYLRPAFGVYAVEVGLDDGRTVPGVANIGRRPTFGKLDENLEVHLFDFAEDLYGRSIEVRLLAFIRAERKFSGLDELKAQIAADSAEARRITAASA